MNLPNLITISRAFMLAVIIWLIYQDWPGAAALAFILSVIAAVSDWLDGYYARKLNQITKFGKIMDAVIDKVFVLGLLIMMLDDEVDILPQWTAPLVWLIVAREVSITMMRMAAARKGIVLAAEKEGKRKTIWQSTAVCVLLFVPVSRIDIEWLDAGRHRQYFKLFEDLVFLWGMGFFLYAFLLTFYSGVLYIPKYWKALSSKPEHGNS